MTGGFASLAQAAAALLAGLCVFAGCYYLFGSLFGLPTVASSLAVRRAGRPTRAKPTVLDVWLGGLSKALSKRIEKLQSDAVRERRAAVLRAAGDPRTPAEELADCIVKSLPFFLAGLLCLPVFPVFCPVLCVLSAGYGVHVYRSAGKKAEEKKDEIERELPALVARIAASLKHGRNVLSVIDACRPYAGPALRKELDITSADMRTGNDDAALSRLETRVGSPLLSEAVRGLRAVLRGDDTETYWQILAVKCADAQKQRLKKKAAAIPRRVKRLSLCLLLCFLLTYLTVIGVQLADSLGVLFG